MEDDISNTTIHEKKELYKSTKLFLDQLTSSLILFDEQNLHDVSRLVHGNLIGDIFKY